MVHIEVKTDRTMECQVSGAARQNQLGHFSIYVVLGQTGPKKSFVSSYMGPKN